MAILHLGKNDFNAEVKEAKGLVLVDFWATWCGPCRMIAPILEEIDAEYSDKVKICKVDVDDEPELAQEFQVMSIPTLVIVQDGQVIKRIVGLQSKEKLLSALNIQ